MASQIVLRLEGVSKRFGGFTALDNITLDIADGEFLTIVGPSGSGKTTMIRLLVGMDAPTEGAIYLSGREITHVPANKRPTCMVFQSLALFPHRTVGQNIEFPLKIKGVPPAARRERALELLQLLRLPADYYGKGVMQCSGGERQRVALARALAFDPEILFFDEPLSALDYRLRKTLEKELKDLHRRTGKTFVYITHSLEEAMVMSDRIAIMRSGKIVQIGTAEEIYNTPESRFVAEFMGEVNLFALTGTGGGGFQAPKVGLQVERSTLAIAEGENATLMVRPEFIRFLGEGDSADCRLEGELHNDFVLGSRVHYEVELADGRVITVEKLGEARFQGDYGDRVALGFDLAHGHLIHEA